MRYIFTKYSGIESKFNCNYWNDWPVESFGKSYFPVNNGDRIEAPGTSIRLTGSRLHHVLFKRVKVEWKSLSKAHFFAPLFSLSPGFPFPKEGQPGVIQSHLGDKLITSFWVSYFFLGSPHLLLLLSPENIFTSVPSGCNLFPFLQEQMHI